MMKYGVVGRSRPVRHPGQKTDNCQDQQEDEQDLRDTGSAVRNSTETEDCHHRCDDRKYGCVLKHDRPLQNVANGYFLSLPTSWPMTPTTAAPPTVPAALPP